MFNKKMSDAVVDLYQNIWNWESQDLEITAKSAGVVVAYLNEMVRQLEVSQATCQAQAKTIAAQEERIKELELYLECAMLDAENRDSW
jgi:hypothetical protein